MRKVNRLLGAGILLTVAGLTTSVHAQNTTPLPSSVCASLQGMSILASAIGLPTGGGVVETAAAVPATAKDNPNGDFCKAARITQP